MVKNLLVLKQAKPRTAMGYSKPTSKASLTTKLAAQMVVKTKTTISTMTTKTTVSSTIPMRFIRKYNLLYLYAPLIVFILYHLPKV